MNLKELDDFRLDDAVKFNDELNPALFDGSTLKPNVRSQLLTIAEDFMEHLGVTDLEIDDITLSGSNAAYSYTPHSDIDLHIIVDMSKLRDDLVYRELFNAKKNLYNSTHDITINDYDVELYVQDSNDPVVSLGEYSILKNKWIHIPRKRRANFDQAAANMKYNKLMRIAEAAAKHKNLDMIEKVLSTIKKYRKAGLDAHGEYGPENLAYKAIRSKGVIDHLYKILEQLHSERLSIPESKQLDKPDLSVSELAKKHNTTRMAILNQLYKGIKVEKEHTSKESVAREIALNHLAEDPKYYDKLEKADLEESAFSVSDFKVNRFESMSEFRRWIRSPKESLRGMPRSLGDHYANILPTTSAAILESNGNLSIKLRDAKALSSKFKQLDQRDTVQIKVGNSIAVLSLSILPADKFSRIEVSGFTKPKKIVKINLDNNDHIDSIEFSDGSVFPEASEFTIVENTNLTNTIFFTNESAASKAFTMLWMWLTTLESRGWSIEKYMSEGRLKEASGYIPSEKEKNDPRFKTGLTVDVRPDAIKKNAKALGFKVSRAGIPPLLRK